MTASRVKPPAPPRLGLSIGEAAAALGVSVDYFREHVAPEVRIVRVGRRRIVSVRELETWLDRHGEAAIGVIE